MQQEIARRLEKALGDRSIRSLQQALEERGVPGSSYPNVYAYLKGRTRPSVEFLSAVAEELEVDPAWLAFGRGHMTETEAARDRGSQRVLEPIEQEIEDALRDGFPAIAKAGPGPGIYAAWFTWHQVYSQGVSLGDLDEVARRVGRAFQAPLDALGIQAADLSDWQLQNYAVLLGQAIQAATVTPVLLRTPTLTDDQEDTDAS